MTMTTLTWKLQLVVIPVSDVDRSKSFYIEKMGFDLDVDHRAGDDFRVVQLTPAGSSCSVTLMKNAVAAGSVNGLHLFVTDIEAAHAELTRRGADPSAYFYFGEHGQTCGLHPERADYGSFFSITDPDGTGWLIQEVNRPSTSD